MKKQYAITVFTLVAIAFIVLFLLSFFLWENRLKKISQEKFFISEAFHEFMNSQDVKELEKIHDQSQSVIYNQELKDLTLIHYCKNFRQNDYINLLQDIIANNSYSNLSRSLGRIYFVNFLLTQEEKIFVKYLDQSQKYLDYFQNSNQEYFNFALFLKILFYERKKELDFAKSYAKQLIAMNDVNDFLREQSKIILTKIKNSE